MTDFTHSTDLELQNAIAGTVGPVQDAAIAEAQRRQIQRAAALVVKPHWLIWATFVAAVIAAIVAVIQLLR